MGRGCSAMTCERQRGRFLYAAIGICGSIAYSVGQRVQESGIRLALGAESRRIRNMVVFPGPAAGSYGRGLRARRSVWVDTLDRQLSVWCEATGFLVFLSFRSCWS